MKPSHTANDNPKDDLIRRTREVWQPRLGRDLSREDARPDRREYYRLFLGAGRMVARRAPYAGEQC